MPPLLYGPLVPWYRLLTPPEEYEEEAAAYTATFDQVVPARPRTLLELGAGAGHNAFYLKRSFQCTLTDLSPEMLALSRGLNPDCEHLPGDMRALRLDRRFDAVLVHDAIVYMTNEADLAAAIATAFVHTRPGGAALFAPDCVRETFAESSELFTGDDGARALRCLEWSWDPDPNDSTYQVEYAFLLREGTDVRAVHDRHVEGLFSRATWQRLFREAGFDVELVRRPIGDGKEDEIFLCRKPSV
jgi:SAM-dependent methyltransferase